LRQALLLSLAISSALLVTSCDSGGGSASATSASSGETETVLPTTSSGTTTTETPPPPPPLTHKQFIRRLDRLCKVGNRALDRRFKTFENLNDTTSSMDAYASWLKRGNRYIAKWDRRHGFFDLDPAEPKDIRDYRRYKALTRQLRNLSERELVAARRHDFDEIVRLGPIEERIRSHRTRLTSGMGLVYCGA
jgi:hypothetical protein